MVASGVPCGVISAFRSDLSEDENSRRHGELLDILLRNGFSPVEARGEWDGLPELCWVVPGIGLSELIELGSEFGQEAVAYAESGRHELHAT